MQRNALRGVWISGFEGVERLAEVILFLDMRDTEGEVRKSVSP